MCSCLNQAKVENSHDKTESLLLGCLGQKVLEEAALKYTPNSNVREGGVISLEEVLGT
jgi:hypothetical protein